MEERERNIKITRKPGSQEERKATRKEVNETEQKMSSEGEGKNVN